MLFLRTMGRWCQWRLGVLDLLAAVGLVVEQDVAADPPHGRADGGEGHVGRYDLGVGVSVVGST